MNYLKLRGIKKLCFDYREISQVLGVNPDSARVFANRYVKSGFLLRIKRNLYTLREKWDNISERERFILANLIQVPSYISLMTALSYYEITTQIQQDFIESIAIKRTKEAAVEQAIFNYTKIRKELYFGFLKIKDFFIAAPEKAFLDALYLASLKKYKFVPSSLDLSKMDTRKINKMAQKFPMQTKKFIKSIYGNRKEARNF